jgi:hypothetical protein
MKSTRHSEEQIIAILKQGEAKLGTSSNMITRKRFGTRA